MKTMVWMWFAAFLAPLFGMFIDSPDMRGAVTDLGGGREAGGEPDIFAGGDEGADDGSAGDEGSDDQGDSSEAGDSAGADAGAGDEGEGVDEGDEQAGEEGAGESEGAGEEEGQREQKTPEQLEAERKAAEAKKPLTEEEKKIEQTLQEAYRSNPKLKEAFKAFPELRAPFFKAAQINKIYPGGIDEATRAKEWAQDLFKIDQLYYGSGPSDLKSKREFLNFMYQESLDKDGKSTGHYEAISEIIYSDTLSNIEAQLAQQPGLAAAISKELNPKQVSTAIEIVRRAAQLLTGRPLAKEGSGPRAEKTVDLGPNAADMTPRERQLAEENARLRSAQQEREQTESAQAEQVFNKSIYDNFFTGIKPEIDKRMPAIVKSGTGRLQKWFVNDVLDTLHEKMREDTFFDAQLRAVVRSGDRGQQHVAELADMMKQRALTLLPTAVRQIVEELQSKTSANGGGNSRRGNERPRKEPVTSGSPGRLNRPSGRAKPTAAHSSEIKTTGDYNRDADRILGIE